MLDDEECCLQIFLEWYNKQMNSNYEKKGKMDQDSKDKMYDYLCEDTKTGNQIAVEVSTLYESKKDIEYSVGWSNIFSEVRKQVKGKLNGTFMIHTPIPIYFKKKDSQKLIEDITESILKKSKKLINKECIELNLISHGLSVKLERVADIPSQLVCYADKKTFRISPEYVQKKVERILKNGKNSQLSKGKEAGLETFLLLENHLRVSIEKIKANNENIFKTAIDAINPIMYSSIDHIFIIKNTVHQIF